MWRRRRSQKKDQKKLIFYCTLSPSLSLYFPLGVRGGAAPPSSCLILLNVAAASAALAAAVFLFFAGGGSTSLSLASLLSSLLSPSSLSTFGLLPPPPPFASLSASATLSLTPGSSAMNSALCAHPAKGPNFSFRAAETRSPAAGLKGLFRIEGR